MAGLPDLTGTWRGEYQYDDGSAPAVSFTMSLKQGQHGRIVGSVQDGPGGDPELATVRGRLFGRDLVFGKRQQHRWVTTPTGLIRFEEAIPAIYAGSIPEAADLPVISYHGAVAADGRTISGTWLIPETILPTQTEDRILRFAARTGTWSAVLPEPE